MAGKESPRGPTSETVRKNVTSARESLNLTYTQVSARLSESGWSISPVGVRRIESGDRRVDVDDLVALAVALEVSPTTLLMPTAEAQDTAVTATATGELSGRDLVMWLQGAERLPTRQWSAHAPEMLPDWHIDVELDRLGKSADRLVNLAELTELVNRVKALEDARGDD